MDQEQELEVAEATEQAAPEVEAPESKPDAETPAVDDSVRTRVADALTHADGPQLELIEHILNGRLAKASRALGDLRGNEKHDESKVTTDAITGANSARAEIRKRVNAQDFTPLIVDKVGPDDYANVFEQLTQDNANLSGADKHKRSE